MKRIPIVFFAVASILSACHDWPEENRNRTAKAEQICTEINHNMFSFQVFLIAFEQSWVIDEVSPIVVNDKDVGYSVTFDRFGPVYFYRELGSNHDPNLKINIPDIGFRLSNDGLYYWTLDDKWMIDDDNEKVPVINEKNEGGGGDGDDVDFNPEDYIVPKLDIDDNDDNDGNNDIWEYTPDDETWIPLYPVLDNDNDDNGKDKDKGRVENLTPEPDSFIDSIVIDDDSVIVTFDDSIIYVYKYKVYDLVYKKFSVASGKQVYFSPGNLQYNAKNNVWRFAEHQWESLISQNDNISSTYDGWIDLFGWGTGNNPTLAEEEDNYYNTFSDWGNNYISGGAKVSKWRTPTREEWDYLCESRPNAEKLRGLANVNGVNGYVFLPDDCANVVGLKFIRNSNESSSNRFTIEEWKEMEHIGAIFLPITGSRYGTHTSVTGRGSYWSANKGSEFWDWGSEGGFYLHFGSSDQAHIDNTRRRDGLGVRLIQNAGL